MPAIAATAPGKVILFGEHAVVFGRPAIAAPVFQVRVKAVFSPEPRGELGQVRIFAPGIGLNTTLDHLPEKHPLAFTLSLACRYLKVDHLPALTLRITSSIPVASGLGSGAAVSVAVLRGLSAFLGRPLDNAAISELAFEVEKLHHGTPSGVDNTVITYAMPVYYVKGQPIQPFQVPVPFHLVIADTGVRSPTRAAVADVRRRWENEPDRSEELFTRIGAVVEKARNSIETGRPLENGPLMDENHSLLQQIGVSSPDLDRLVDAARTSGALGAKLSGGGRGGNMIALVSLETIPAVTHALTQAGAVHVIDTEIR